jgi:hypothetical protein
MGRLETRRATLSAVRSVPMAMYQLDRPGLSIGTQARRREWFLGVFVTMAYVHV